jgi:hypothetical protein
MTMTSGDARPECCRAPNNLYVAEARETEDGTLTIRKCRACGRRHFEMMARPKVVGLSGR